MADFASSKSIILKGVRLDYFDLFEPAPQNDKDKADLTKKNWKYKVRALFPRESDAANIVKAAFMEAATGVWGANAANVVQNLSKNQKAVRDGDGELDKQGATKTEYKGMLFISASNKARPLVIAHRMHNGAPVNITENGLAMQNGQVIAAPFEIKIPYRGCFGNVKVQLCAMNAKGDAPMQVFARLEAFQFSHDGEAFGAPPPSAEGFDYDASEEAAAGGIPQTGAKDLF